MTTPENQAAGLDLTVGDSDIDYPPPDDFFEALVSSKRRRLLAAIPAEAAVSVDELTDTLADGQSTADQRAKVKIELVHAHLPLLADAGLVTYEDGEVTRPAYPEPVEELVAFAGEYESVVGESGPR